MRLYEIREDAQWERRYWVDASHKWGLPGIRCRVCRSVWGTAAVAYPAIDLSALADSDRYLEPPITKHDQYEGWRAPIRRLLSDKSLPLLVGAAFGPLIGRAKGRFPDFVWTGAAFALLVGSETIEQLKDAGVRGLVPAKTELRFLTSSHPELFELQIEPHGHLARAALPPDGAPPCPGCGRRGITRPSEIMVTSESVPGNLDLFRLEDLPTCILVTERFKEAAEKLGLTGAIFLEVKVSAA